MSTLKQRLENRVKDTTRWETRRQLGADGPNMENLWVLACMDERMSVDEALGIHADSGVGGGDAHLFRNAGGIVTDDAIRSAMLTINFFGTTEIVVVQHTGCGMLSANGHDLEAALRGKGIDLDNIPIDPSLPELSLDSGAFAKWIGMMDDVDKTCIKCVDQLLNHPLIPDDITISGWVWETEFRRLRAPDVNAATRAVTQATTASMGVKGDQPPRWS
ncbi:carbonic anhydrase [Solemya elarraichensis gill symbiont]|uniref:Carbonic anhydrase n=2 Tax=Solemya elarraichensis gill symbiont TaxID=1918949 RepID=A0A1T2LAW8_9GAMM|nr:carbonic anhydrase [Solemya elarraichensis gill symbiont]